MASVESQSVVVELSINGQVLTRQRLLVTMLCPPQQALLSEQLEALADELESGSEPSSGSPVEDGLTPAAAVATGEQLTVEQLDRMLRMVEYQRLGLVSFYVIGDCVYSASDPDTPIASFSGEDCVERAREYAAYRLTELERETS